MSQTLHFCPLLFTVSNYRKATQCPKLLSHFCFSCSTIPHPASSSTRPTSSLPGSWLSTCCTWTATRRSTSSCYGPRTSTSRCTRTGPSAVPTGTSTTCTTTTRPCPTARCVVVCGTWTLTARPSPTSPSGSIRRTAIPLMTSNRGQPGDRQVRSAALPMTSGRSRVRAIV